MREPLIERFESSHSKGAPIGLLLTVNTGTDTSSHPDARF